VTAQGVVEQTLEVNAQSQDFHVPLPAPPDLVRIDPGYTVLAKITFDPPEAMLRRQLRDTNDVIGRIVAVGAFGRRQSRAAVEALRETLKTDPIHAVRTEAAQALRSIHSDEAFEVLSASLDQSDPRVRIAVLNALGGFHREQVAALAEARLRNESHPDVRLAAIRLLGHPARSGGGGDLVAWLGTNSFRQQIAGAVLGVLREREDPAVVPDLLKFLQERGASLPTDVQSAGVSTLAWLSRNETDKAAVRGYLVSRVNDPRPQLRRAALSALGTLGDPRAVPVLESFARASKSSPEQSTASAALERLRNERRPAVEFEELRREVLDLQRSERELKERVESLKKTWEATRTTPATNRASGDRKSRR
jgi:aminopeptidase N